MTVNPLHNWQLKLLSLISAVVLWFFVVGIENTVYLFPETIQVKAHNLGGNVSLATALPEVKIYVNTGGKDIKTSSISDFEAFVDLSGLGEGSYELPVLTSTKNAQVSVLKTDPAKIKVLLAPVGEKEVTIKFSAKGTPAPGYEVKEIKADTSKVKITAARSILDKIVSLNAEVVLAGTETADVIQTVSVVLPPELNLQAESVQIATEQIKATIVIIPAIVEKSLKITPILTGAENLETIRKEIIVMPSAVTVKGEENFLKEMDQVATKPIAAELLQNRSVPLPVELDLPEGLELVAPIPRITLKLASDKF